MEAARFPGGWLTELLTEKLAGFLATSDFDLEDDTLLRKRERKQFSSQSAPFSSSFSALQRNELRHSARPTKGRTNGQRESERAIERQHHHGKRKRSSAATLPSIP